MEEAYEIFDYLPINKRSSTEQDYIDHLWQSFLVLSESNNPNTVSFSVFPYHLLFMLSVQYKILRISKFNQREYQLVFTFRHTRGGNDDILTPDSVFQLGTINESSLLDFLRLVNVNQEIIKSCKDMVKNRNDQIAHAKGGIESDPETRILQYLDMLKQIQNCFLKPNDEVATIWLKEISLGQDEVEYIESHLANEYLCSADMQQGKLAKLDERLDGYI